MCGMFCIFANVNDKMKANMATDKTAYWLDIADYDLDTAEAMHQTVRWLYVAFMCHQVIEKTLKAYWCATRDDDPPYTHNHKRLADGCGLYQQLTTDQREFIETITNYNIEAATQRTRRNSPARSPRRPADRLSTKQNKCSNG